MVLSLSEVPVLDRNAEALGVTVESLMENAGRAVARRVADAVPPGPVTIVVGPGNNGGDGLVAARLLSERGYRVRVVTPVPAMDGFRSPLARRAAEALPPSVDVAWGVAASDAVRAVGARGVVVDALLGAGLAGAPREPFAAFVRAINASGGRVFAVDVPTGLGSELAVRPDVTITFHDVKEGMTPASCGAIMVEDIGIPARASTHTGPGEMTLYPRPRVEQHKGEGGIVLVIGGGPYTGAPAVSGLAALRSGADLAIVLTPRRAWPIVSGYSPNLVVRPLNRDDLDLDDPENRVTLNLWLKKAHSVVVGPGLGLAERAVASAPIVVERAVREGKPVIVDADAIAAIAEKPHLLKDRRVIVTPHKREFRTLTGRDAPEDYEKRAEVVRLAAADLGCTILLKGPVDVVTDGQRVKLNATGHPAMSVGGTGDSLAGVVAALAAKGLAPFDAARVGAYLNGLAGERAVAEKSMGLVATDVVEALPSVLRDHLR